MQITELEIRNSINTVYIFGDNLQHKGLGGQAKIARPFIIVGKSYGIPTKRKPTMNEDAFFADRDDEIRAVEQSFKDIEKLYNKGLTIKFFPRIGEGMAQIDKRSPKIYRMITEFIEKITKNG